MAELLCERPYYGSGLDGHGVVHCGRKDGTLRTKEKESYTGRVAFRNRAVVSLQLTVGCMR